MKFETLEELSKTHYNTEGILIIMNREGREYYHKLINGIAAPPEPFDPEKRYTFDGFPIIEDKEQEEMVRFAKYVD